MRTWLIYTSRPEPKPLAFRATRELANDLVERRKMELQAKMEITGNESAATLWWGSAQIAQIELPD